MIPEAKSFLMRVAILDRDPIMGRILERLLRACDCDARHLEEGVIEEPGTFENVRVVLLGSGWDAERWKVLVEKMLGAPSGGRIPFLKLGTPGDDAPAHSDQYVPWPCPPEDLKSRIEGASPAGLWIEGPE